jgi:hypothetical protein
MTGVSSPTLPTNTDTIIIPLAEGWSHREIQSENRALPNAEPFRKEARLSENMLNPNEKTTSLDGWDGKWVSLK